MDAHIVWERGYSIVHNDSKVIAFSVNHEIRSSEESVAHPIKPLITLDHIDPPRILIVFFLIKNEAVSTMPRMKKRGEQCPA